MLCFSCFEFLYLIRSAMMNENLATFALLAPLLAGIVASLPLRNVEVSARMATVITGIGFVAAVGLAIASVHQDAVRLTFGTSALSLELDPLAMIMLLLVLGLSFITQSFAIRYLRGDQRQRWFVATANLLTVTTAVMVSASTVVMFAAAWVASGVALVSLLATYRTDSQARDGVRQTARRFAIGDVAFLIGVSLICASGGVDTQLADVGVALAGLPVTVATLAVLLLIIPALARSSQIPFQGWLPATLATPTPVSALMHAGVVNAGAILIIRFAPAVNQSALALQLLFAAGSATLVYAAVLRMTKPDVKGRLVFSTMAQMGFMMMACGLGAYAAAVFHLVAHGLFKSSLFFSAGSGIERATFQRSWPSQKVPTGGTIALSVVVSLSVSLGAVWVSRVLVWPEISASSVALLTFVVIAAAVTFGGALLSRPSLGVLLSGSVAIVALALAYTLALRFVTMLLGDPATPATAVSPWWVVLPGLLLLSAGVLPRLSHRPSVVRDVIYAQALAASTPRVFTLKGN
jgi:NAD(P)H-quinone oxidoreductase subunit 5